MHVSLSARAHHSARGERVSLIDSSYIQGTRRVADARRKVRSWPVRDLGGGRCCISDSAEADIPRANFSRTDRTLKTC